ncbi:MAG TPA: hypothetical protein VIG06_17515 [Kofleriaceae bacterium]|jgi:alkylated DNA repair dioxygenase AlkB
MRRQLALFGRSDERGFDILERGTSWRSERRVMYERKVVVPRLIASLPRDGDGHPVLEGMRAALDARYRTNFVHLSMALYRDGKDSVAFHGDTTARDLPEALVATVSLGFRRRFFLRPAAGGESIAFALGEGDLVGPRISIMFRPVWYRD